MNRQLASIEAKFANGNYYDILQTYKALYFRNASAKKYKETVDLLISGATNFQKYEQWNCSAELSALLVETYKNFKTTYSDETKDTILNIFKGFKTMVPAAISFMRDALKWSEEYSAGEKGSPDFHTALANALAETGDYIDAQKHYIFGNGPLFFSKMLHQWSDDAPITESDLYLARGVLGYLCVKKLDQAKVLFDDFTKDLEQSSFTPLLNYIRFLLMTLERDALPLFNTLKQNHFI
eukprot:gene7757-9096_t